LVRRVLVTGDAGPIGSYMLIAIPNWTMRHAAKPGITGWAQVRLGYIGDRDRSEAKLSHDLWYLRHGTLLLDLAICVRTVAALVPRRWSR
jgi:lipopolysaccharide/colanic/teichoic acid biosynthesis glycosyltransferase